MSLKKKKKDKKTKAVEQEVILLLIPLFLKNRRLRLQHQSPRTRMLPRMTQTMMMMLNMMMMMLAVMMKRREQPRGPRLMHLECLQMLSSFVCVVIVDITSHT